MRPDQSVQNLGGIGTSSSGYFFDTVTLPATGTYTLHIDPGTTNTGCATLTLYDVPPDTTAAVTVGGAPVTVCNTVPGQDIRLTFSGTAGQVVRLRVTGSTLTNAFVTLVRGTQTVQNIGGFGTSDVTLNATQPLPATDTYTLFVNPAGTNTGCATFTLTQV